MKDASIEGEDANALFVKLLMQHERHLRHYIRSLVTKREDAEDVYQETVLAVWKKFDEYDRSRPFFSWAARFGYFQSMNFRQKQKVRDRYVCDEVLELIAAEWPVQDAFEEKRHMIAGCLSKLKDRDRKVVELRYAEEKSIASGAEDIGMTPKQVYKALERIRVSLLKCVNGQMVMEKAL